jgi:soluble cytochrome b562
MNVASTSALSPTNTSTLSGMQSKMKQFMSDMQSLQKALSNGNIDDAQKAMQAIQKDQKSLSSNGMTAPKQLTDDLKSVSDALNSGNLSAAQSAFATLQTNAQNVRQAMGGISPGSTTYETSNTGATTSSTLLQMLENPTSSNSSTSNESSTLLQILENSTSSTSSASNSTDSAGSILNTLA